MNPPSTPTASPWHSGERALQQKTGVVERMESVGRRVLRDHLPDQHRSFFAQLPFVVAGTVDGHGDAWAALLCARPGFLQSPTDRQLHAGIAADPHDPASAGLREGAAIGLLGIELHTRRRNRVNGTVRNMAANGFDVDVAQSFGNCPKYIQARDLLHNLVSDTGTVSDTNTLLPPTRAMIERADTFFVASYAEEGGRRQVDVSHRGGKAGFVRVNGDGSLTVPDFAGNLFFATLGNFLVNPRAGLVFVDFETGDVLQLTGDATVDLDAADIAAFQGAERLWHFRPRRIVHRPGALPLRWVFQADGWSPHTLATGSWPSPRNS